VSERESEPLDAGRRLEKRLELDATPEQVWEAIGVTA
jgi:hypothetical protein